MKLSIFLAGIRTSLWKDLYDSIPLATTIDDYELIFVSPYDLPLELKGNPKVRLIKDYGCPSRCYQLGLLHSRGEYVVWAADDGVFSPTMSIDKAFRDIPKHKKGLVSLKYFEGPVVAAARKQEHNEWWYLRRHKTLKKCPYANSNYFMVMNALIRRDYFMEIGGFDCRFEHLGVGAVDVGVRLQNDGGEVVLGEKFLDVGHMPGNSGDHAPIHAAHVENDYPLFVRIYTSQSGSNRSKIDFDNWKQSPDVWTRRFSAKNLP